MAKKHAPTTLKQSTVSSSCEKEFPSYYSLQQQRRKEHGAKQRKPSDTVADLNKIVQEEAEDGEKLKDELSACQHFLVDTEMENGSHKVFNFQMSKLDTKIIKEKLEEVFNKLDSAAKIKIALGFVLRNVETGEYRYYKAHENHTLFEKPYLLCTKADLIWIQGKLKNLISWRNALKNVRTQTGGSNWSQKLLFLLHYWKTSQWCVQTLSCLNLYYDIRK